MPRRGELLSTYAHQPLRWQRQRKNLEELRGAKLRVPIRGDKKDVACRLWSLTLLAPRHGTSQFEYVANRDLGFGWWETGNWAYDWWSGFSYLNTLPGWKFYTHGCPRSSLLWYNISSSVIWFFSILPVKEVSSVFFVSLSCARRNNSSQILAAISCSVEHFHALAAVYLNRLHSAFSCGFFSVFIFPARKIKWQQWQFLPRFQPMSHLLLLWRSSRGLRPAPVSAGSRVW